MVRRQPFWVDALLVVVTLGLYAPFWLWRRNADLRGENPGIELPPNGALLLAGIVLGVLDPVFEVGGNRYLATSLLVAGVMLFSAGTFVLLRNAETVAEARRLSWRVPPALASGLVLAAFLAVEAGNFFGSLSSRGLALVLLGSLPFAFYYVHDDLETVHAHGEAPRAPEPPRVTS